RSGRRLRVTRRRLVHPAARPPGPISRCCTLARVEIVLQQQRRGPRVHVLLAAPRRAAQLAHRLQHAGGGEPLVPQLDRPAGAPCDVVGQRPGRGRRRTLRGFRIERQADDDPDDAMGVEESGEFLHGEAFAGAAGQRGEGLREGLGFVGERHPDAALAPVHAEQPPAGHPCCMVAKNSLLFFVRFMRSSRNSMPSTGGMSARKLRRRYTLLSSSLVRSSSSLRVPERCTSMEGKVRRSAMRRSRITSMLPVPLNSSKITSSMREPVSMSTVPTIVSEPPPSILRAAPKNRLGFCRALASTPPDRILPECGTTTLCARPMR